MSLPLFTCRPIGIIHTPHTDPAQTPRQPIHAADFTGQVEIFPEFAAGLEGLEHYVRIWLLFAFHRAEAPRLHVIPHGQTQERGVFTTRAPCRPGGIGMSLKELYDERLPMYEHYAGITVDVNDLSITAAARKVADALAHEGVK